MFKKLFLFCFMSLFLMAVGYADTKSTQSLAPIECAKELKGCLSKIQQLPEARQLIATVQKEGNIRIIVNNDPHLTKDFGAFWDPCNRVITVNYSKNISEGSLIGSIIFELHNALVNSKITYLDKMAAAGKIDRNAYVEGFERLEYQNSKDASSITQKGIERGIFPKSAFLPTYSTFEEHFHVQKEYGHSAFIAKNYDHLAPRKVSRNRHPARFTTNRQSRGLTKAAAAS